MCAAKLERTGFVFRNVWPKVKNRANDQAATFAHSANDGGLVRKNSHKAEAAANAAGRSSGVAFAASSRQPPRRHLPRVRLCSTRPVAADLLRSCSPTSPQAALLQQGPPLAPTASYPREDDLARCGVGIEELLQTASEKCELNKDFWGKYKSVASMAKATEKSEILQILENFVVIRKKHYHLFQRFKCTILANLELWSAPDFAALCHSWAQLGCLHEDILVAMAPRVVATVHLCSAEELCWLMDAYATVRCMVSSVTDAVVVQTLLRLEDFSDAQLCLHASAFARLGIQNERLFELIAERLVRAIGEDGGAVSGAAAPSPCSSSSSQEEVSDFVEAAAVGEPVLSARDLTLAAYSFAKLGFFFPDLFSSIARSSLVVIRDFTARDLQMLSVALARAQHRHVALLSAVSLQAQRRIAQFSAESLALMLRSVAFFGVGDAALFTRAVAQLPRAILKFRPVDVTTLLGAFAAAQVHSLALFDIVTPFILEKAPMFTPVDWISALRGYSALGHKDPTFLHALGLHMKSSKASKLTFGQLCNAMVDCSRLSFTGISATLADAALESAVLEQPCIPLEAAAQMYSALLLLGHSAVRAGPTADERVHDLLNELALRLRCGSAYGADRGFGGHEGTMSELSLTACANLCLASLLAPPPGSSTSSAEQRPRHPVDAVALLERCVREAAELSAEERGLLRLVLAALGLMPWSRCALRSAQMLEGVVCEPAPALPGAAASAGVVEAEATPCHLPEPFFRAALGHLVPQQGIGGEPFVPRTPWRGVFAAHEMSGGLADLASALDALGVERRLVLDRRAEAHVAVRWASLLEAAAAAGVADGNVATLAVESDAEEVALLWGSPLHYLDAEAGTPKAARELRPSPATRLQVAVLRADCGVEVVIVPHWWWPRTLPLEKRGKALVEFLVSSPDARRRRLRAGSTDASGMSIGSHELAGGALPVAAWPEAHGH